MQKLNEIDDLIRIISKLPGLGPKSAKRIVLKLINNRDELIKPMANVLAQVYKNITRCNHCGALKSKITDCGNCEDKKEKYDKICVVEDIADQWSIENSNIYKGYFHILGGTISSVGQRKEDLLINSLIILLVGYLPSILKPIYGLGSICFFVLANTQPMADPPSPGLGGI